MQPSKLILNSFQGFLSMWISNTAATAMMIPIVDAIAQVAGTDPDAEESNAEQQNAPLASADDSFEDTEPIVEFKVVDEGTDKRPVVLQEIGKQPSKFFMSETQKKVAFINHVVSWGVDKVAEKSGKLAEKWLKSS